MRQDYLSWRILLELIYDYTQSEAKLTLILRKLRRFEFVWNLSQSKYLKKIVSKWINRILLNIYKTCFLRVKHQPYIFEIMH